MGHELQEQSGRGMLIRLGVVIAFIGRTAFFATSLYAGGLLAVGIVAIMCDGPNAERELYNMIGLAVALGLGAFVILMISSIISWIIIGTGDLITFAAYLLARLGTFLMTMGIIMVLLILYGRLVAGGCQLGSLPFIVFAGICVLTTGFMAQVGTMVLAAWHRTLLDKQTEALK